MEWKEVRLGEVCDLIAGFAFKAKDFGEFPTKVVKIGDIKPPFVDYVGQVGVDISRYDTEKLLKYTVRYGDYVLAMTGATIGKVGKYISEHTSFINQRVLKFSPKQDVDAGYINYTICSNIFAKYVVNYIDSESAQPNISAQTISKFVLRIPQKEEDQHRIASILSSLDRKIELNNKINADLEEMAQAIFKNWFVDFEPFKDGKFVDSELGMIPEGWKVISLSEIMKYNGGSQPPASEFIDTYQEGYIRFIQIRDYDNDSHITYIPISKRNKLCDELDIMIARYGAALGRICWGLKGAYNVALAKVTPIKSYYREYLRCYLNTSYFYQSINNKGARCAQSGFNQSDINSYMIAFPIDETVVMNFNDLCSSIMDKRLSLKYENSRLSLLRDTLLPRLMSGELEIPE